LVSVGPMEKDYLILRRAWASRPSGEWNDDDYDVLADGEAVGRIFNANAAPVGSPWMWTLIFPHHEGRTPTRLRGDARGRRWGRSRRVGRGSSSKIGKSAFGGKPDMDQTSPNDRV